VTFWWWVLIFGGIAIGGLALFAVLGLQLWHKIKALLKELGALSAAFAILERAMGPAVASDEPAWQPDPLAIGRHRSE
jgi:hypothetical protein